MVKTSSGNASSENRNSIVFDFYFVLTSVLLWTYLFRFVFDSFLCNECDFSKWTFEQVTNVLLITQLGKDPDIRSLLEDEGACSSINLFPQVFDMCLRLSLRNTLNNSFFDRLRVLIFHLFGLKCWNMSRLREPSSFVWDAILLATKAKDKMMKPVVCSFAAMFYTSYQILIEALIVYWNKKDFGEKGVDCGFFGNICFQCCIIYKCESLEHVSTPQSRRLSTSPDCWMSLSILRLKHEWLGFLKKMGITRQIGFLHRMMRLFANVMIIFLTTQSLANGKWKIEGGY